MKTFLAAAAVVALAATPVFAQPGGATAPSANAASAAAAAASQPLSQQDQTFIKQAADGKAEVETGQYVMQHGETPAVREFGRWMVTDHTMADQMLHQIAQVVGAQVPTALSPEAQSMVDRVQKLRGAELDRTYIQDMVQDHEKAVKAFQTEAQSGQNPQVKAFAQQMAPALQQHLTEAQELQQNVTSREARR